MSDILERLKQNQRWLERDGFTTSANNARDAIREIESLTTKLEAAESEARRQMQHVAATLQKLEAAERRAEYQEGKKS